MSNQLESKVVVITGAGRGIGRGLAIGFAEQGARVVCAARSQAQLDETVRAIRDSGGEATAVRCDVTRPRDVQNLYTETRAQFGPVDIVIATPAATSSAVRSKPATSMLGKRPCASTCSGSITPANSP